MNRNGVLNIFWGNGIYEVSCFCYLILGRIFVWFFYGRYIEFRNDKSRLRGWYEVCVYSWILGKVKRVGV